VRVSVTVTTARLPVTAGGDCRMDARPCCP
jgi:hypothetical protein